jgi:hypothetical protein
VCRCTWFSRLPMVAMGFVGGMPPRPLFFETEGVETLGSPDPRWSSWVLGVRACRGSPSSTFLSYCQGLRELPPHRLLVQLEGAAKLFEIYIRRCTDIRTAFRYLSWSFHTHSYSPLIPMFDDVVLTPERHPGTSPGPSHTHSYSPLIPMFDDVVLTSKWHSGTSR